MNENNNLPRQRHPLSALCPPMHPDVFAAMLVDVGERGVQEPVDIFDGMVLDGWHRFNAAHQMGVPCPEHQFTGTLEDAKRHVLGKLLHRDMNASQRALVVVDIHEWRPRGNKPEPGSGFSEHQMAEEAGVTDRTIRQAKAVTRNAIPEVREKVAAGDMSLKQAEQIARQPAREQKAALAEPKKPREASKAPKWKPAEVPKPQVGASLEALREMEERNAILSEEVDRLTDRVAVHFMEGTEEEKAAAAAVIAELRAQVRTLEAETDALKAMRDKYQSENAELINQCRMYRNQLQKYSRQAA